MSSIFVLRLPSWGKWGNIGDLGKICDIIVTVLMNTKFVNSFTQLLNYDFKKSIFIIVKKKIKIDNIRGGANINQE